MVQSTARTETEDTPLIANNRNNANISDIETGPSSVSPLAPNPTPTWSEAFAYVSPYLRPRDRHHSVLALLALLTVLLEKVSLVIEIRVLVFLTQTHVFGNLSS